MFPSPIAKKHSFPCVEVNKYHYLLHLKNESGFKENVCRILVTQAGFFKEITGIKLTSRFELATIDLNKLLKQHDVSVTDVCSITVISKYSSAVYLNVVEEIKEK